MKRMTAILTVALMTLALIAGCGEQLDDNVRARNLKTGEMHTFNSEGEVPDGYAICGSEDCPLPKDLPCELLGAEVCQFQPSCRIKVLACSGGGTADPTTVGCMQPEAADYAGGAEEPVGCLIPEESETCEVTCVAKDFQLCEEITDPQACNARPECRFETPVCGYPCECAGEADCNCLPCEPAGVCVTVTPQTCQNLQSPEACMSNPECQWNAAPCLCDCPDVKGVDEGVECLCDCGMAGFCDQKEKPMFCEAQQDEQACLANPECEWGQFVCPPCMFDEPMGGPEGAPMACDCGLSCRTKQMECPPVPAYEMICPPDVEALPIFDDMGCLVGFECGGERPECPAITMEMIVCEDNQQAVAVHDDKGCQIGWECLELPCPREQCSMFCENGFQKDANGCEICSCN